MGRGHEISSLASLIGQPYYRAGPTVNSSWTTQIGLDGYKKKKENSKLNGKAVKVERVDMREAGVSGYNQNTLYEFLKGLIQILL